MVNQQETLRELALFAGAGGGILGGKLLGWETVCAVENEPYPASVLVARQNEGFLPPFPIWDDVRTFDGRPWRGIVDVVSGGFPCQAFSTATHGNPTAENLWPEMLRIVGEVHPKYVFSENVAEKPILVAQNDLASCGYKTARLKLSAKDLGADHVRSRWWLLAYSDDKSKLFSKVNAEMVLREKFCNYVWESYPSEPRMAHGMAYKLDRFKAIGNGQVPIVAAVAFSQLYTSLMENT